MKSFRRTALAQLCQSQNQQASKLIDNRAVPAKSLRTSAPESQSCKSPPPPTTTTSILTASGSKNKPTSQTNKRQQSTTRANYQLASGQVQPKIRTTPATTTPPLVRPEELENAYRAENPAAQMRMRRELDEEVNPGRLDNASLNCLPGVESLEAQIGSGQDRFVDRHIGPKREDLQAMLATIGYGSLDELIRETVPEEIRMTRRLKLPAALSEHELLVQLKQLAAENEAPQWKSFIGLGYYDCVVPAVILRNIFENPGWTTAYTAYQAEIAQGRLESLMNFQTMISDLTGMDVANASLLDESTAAAEAMQVCYRVDLRKRNRFLISCQCHPQTRAVVETRATGLGIEIDHFDELTLMSSCTGESKTIDFAQYCGVLVQYPNSGGHLFDLNKITVAAKEASCLVAVATDLMACTLFKPPGDFEQPADLVVGSAQRFGVPLNYGGPHAGFLACKQKLIRSIPGRVVGLTRDSNGQPAYRFALQTREQHIRRDKATSNICTAQALLANMSAMYAIYHGPSGLRSIANAIHLKTSLLAHLLKEQNSKCGSSSSKVDIVNEGAYFDTLTLELADGERQLRQVQERARTAKINLRYYDDESLQRPPSRRVAISLDETTKLLDVFRLAQLFNAGDNNNQRTQEESCTTPRGVSEASLTNTLSVPLAGELKHLARQSAYLTHSTFNRYHSEAQLVRYMKSLENKDISLAHSMIPLGSCTMKLNATSQMLASSWPEFAQCHPFQPVEQTRGYQRLFENLNEYLCEITGYDRISFQPNSGAQGEYAGLRVIRAYLDARGETKRNLCLIPISAHGTNPASAQMAGFQIQQVKVLENGNIDKVDFQTKVKTNRDRLACFMITYPSTFGVFEENIREMCSLVHEAGGQVYLDGANMNAQVGLCRPGDYGSDVSHLNLHKTFCIPHGGGGPGAGPIGVKSHLVPYLPTHPMLNVGCANSVEWASANKTSFGTVSGAMWGSPAILPISWSYIRLMSNELKRSSEMAILNANYMRKRLELDYEILYRGSCGNVAHEFIIDCRPFKKTANIEANDIAKRLQDFGLHAPTISWPVSNTLMLEPTESEDKHQLDNYCDALLQIRREIARIESGEWDRQVNPIKQAPHIQQIVCASEWTRPYTREQAAFPAPFVKPTNKIWPTVGRVDDTYGDTNLFCSCPPVCVGATNEA